MRLVDQWRRVRRELPASWSEARLDLMVPRAELRPRAASLLASAGPGRVGDDFRVTVHRAGGGIGPDGFGKLLGKLDAEGIRGTLTLLGTGERTAPAPVVRAGLADAWQLAVAGLPPDWSDLHCEVELVSSDHVDRAALLFSPLNPARERGRSALRFRVSRAKGYGASPEMTHRCLERAQEEEISGRLTLLRVLADTDNVGTQGPVWRVGGRSV
jgi:hypothetical protein